MAKRSMPSVPKTMAAQERKWRAESAISTLAEAERIKRDPALMSDVKKMAQQKAADMAKIARGTKR